MQQCTIEECKRILAKYGLKLIPTINGTSRKELEKISTTLKYPVVMKVFSMEILHKSKSGFVKTNIRTVQELYDEHSCMTKFIKNKKIKKFSILLQNQIEGIEFIVGAKRDATFGSVVLFGLGGIHAELYKKVSLRICPLDSHNASLMVEEIAQTMVSPIMKKKIAEILMKVSRLCAKEKFSEFDLNPIIVNERGISLVDVRILR